jgi:hypothetical protein
MQGPRDWVQTKDQKSWVMRGASTFIKLGSAGRPGGWTGLVLLKEWPVQQPGKTWSTGGLTHDSGKPGQDAMFFFSFFFQMWFFSYTPLFLYFFSCLLTLFKVHYINIRKIFYFSM